MLRRLLLIALFAVQFLAITGGSQAHDPYPTCHPCPFVR